MIKHVSKGILNLDNPDREHLAGLVKLAIERNFGGKLEAAEMMGRSFAQLQGIEDLYKQIPKPDVL
jgi:hypothetical protein